MGTSNLIITTGELTQVWAPDLKMRKRNRTSLQEKRKTGRSIITVESLIASVKPIPSHAILLGRCQDGLPFLMELGDPEIGAVLIGCEGGYGKTHQLQAMVDSAVKTHAPKEMQVLILTLNPMEWDRMKHNPQYRDYVLGIHAWYDPRVEDQIQSLTALAEARRASGKGGPSIMMILDDLNYVEDLSLEAQVNLRWLLAYGAQSGIWLVSTLNASLAQDYQYWIEPCRTRILGRVMTQENTRLLGIRSDSEVSSLSPGEFKIWTGMSWMNYRLPLLGG